MATCQLNDKSGIKHNWKSSSSTDDFGNLYYFHRDRDV